MLDSFVGRNTTQSALNTYLKKHAHGNAKAADLWAAFDKVIYEVITLIITNINMSSS